MQANIPSLLSVAKNSSRSLAAYTALAAKASANLPGTAVEGGSDTTVASNGTSTGSSTGTSSPSPSTTGAAMALTPSLGVAAMLALFMGLIM